MSLIIFHTNNYGLKLVLTYSIISPIRGRHVLQIMARHCTCKPHPITRYKKIVVICSCYQSVLVVNRMLIGYIRIMYSNIPNKSYYLLVKDGLKIQLNHHINASGIEFYLNCSRWHVRKKPLLKVVYECMYFLVCVILCVCLCMCVYIWVRACLRVYMYP